MMVYHSMIKAAKWAASATGYPSIVQQIVNRSPVTTTIQAPDSTNIERGVQLSGDITIGSNANICGGSDLNGEITIGNGVRVGPDSELRGHISVDDRTNLVEEIEVVGDEIFIGKYDAIGRNAVFQNRDHFMHHGTIQSRFYRELTNGPLEMTSEGPLRVGNDVWVGARAIVLSGVEVGDGAVIGAGAIVTNDVEPYSIVAGIPAKRVGWRFDEPTRKQLLDIAWWDWDIRKLKRNVDFFEADLREVSDPRTLVE